MAKTRRGVYGKQRPCTMETMPLHPPPPGQHGFNSSKPHELCHPASKVNESISDDFAGHDMHDDDDDDDDADDDDDGGDDDDFDDDHDRHEH